MTRAVLLGAVVAISVVGAQSGSATDTTQAARNGGTIAFTRTFLSPEHLEIYLLNPDGRRVRPLRTGVVPSWEPAWSPDGRWLAFRGGGDDDLYLIKADGSRLRRLTRDALHESAAAWSPDGSKIAYIRFGRSTASIYVIRVDGSMVKQLTRNAVDGGPYWSPDGSRIVFTRLNAKHPFRGVQIWMMDADGSRQHRIFPTLTDYSDPVWAPDGKQMLLTDGERLYVAGVGRGSGRVLVRLGTSSSGEREEPSPSWSPDGKTVLFNQFDRNGRSDIWSVNVNGSGLERLTTPPRGSLDSDASWRPLLTRH